MSAHRKRPSFLGLKISWEHYVFMVLYALALQQCYNTMGQPYANAVAHHKAMQELQAQANAAVANATAPDLDVGSVPLVPPEPDDFDPFAELSGKPADAAESAATTWGDSVKFGGEDDDEDGPPMPSPFMPALYAILITVRSCTNAPLAEHGARLREVPVRKNTPPRPPPPLTLVPPSPPQAVVAILHILSQLAQHWSINVKVFVNCLTESDVRPGTILKLVPPLHQARGRSPHWSDSTLRVGSCLQG